MITLQGGAAKSSQGEKRVTQLFPDARLSLRPCVAEGGFLDRFYQQFLYAYRETRIDPKTSARLAMTGQCLREAQLEDLDEQLLASCGAVRLRTGSLSSDDLLALAGRLGHVRKHPMLPDSEDSRVVTLDSETVYSSRAAAAGSHSRVDWHHDLAWDQAPVRYSILHGFQVEGCGGDLEVVSTAQLWGHMDDQLARRMRATKAIYSFGEGGVESRHPLVLSNSSSGRPERLFFSAAHAVSAEGQVGLDEVQRAFRSALGSECALQVHEWQDGDTVVLDNANCIHARAPLRPEKRRIVLRVLVGRFCPEFS